MLTTWTAITHVLSGYPRRSQSPDVVTFDWPGSPCSIFQIVRAEVAGRERIFIGINVLPEVQVLSASALKLNSEIAIGALVAFRGWIVLKHALTVGRFDEIELHEVLADMARTVERAQARLGQATSTVSAGYAD